MDIQKIKVKANQVHLFLPETIDWALSSLGVPEIWRISEGEGIKVAILDSGIDQRHPDLYGSILDEQDFTNSSVGAFDRLGHGTHVAGIIAARTNHYGIIGVAPKVSLLNAKVIDNSGNGSSRDLAKAIHWAIEKGADIINMSLGSPLPNEEVKASLRVAVGKGIIPVAAAGNYGSIYFDTVNYPAKYDYTISVGSVNRSLLRSNFSATGGQLDIMAPGEEVYSCYPMGMYAKLSGTSMATPFVSGVAALCLAKHRLLPSNTPCDDLLSMRAHLQKTAIDLGELGPDRFHGYGLINPPAMLG